MAVTVKNSLEAVPKGRLPTDECYKDCVEEVEPEVSALRRRLVWILPAIITVAWFLFLMVGGHTERVASNWEAAATMVFGGFVAGSTPQGGGAIAFPVFTKLLEVPTSAARSFSLFVQASGMVMASISILLAGRKVDFKALGLGITGGLTGFVVGLVLLGDSSTPLWDSRIDTDFVKASFTLIVFAVALIVRLISKKPTMYDSVPSWNYRSIAVMLTLAFAGGVFSSLSGSGSDVLLFVFVVLVAKVDPKVAIPTSIITMASVSLLGFLILGVWHGQLDIALAGNQVVAIGGTEIDPRPASQYDLFGLWLAGAPVVLWFAPVGSWVASRVSTRAVIAFVGLIAFSELLSTALFLDALRTNISLLIFSLVGLLLVWAGVSKIDSLSEWIMRADDPSEGKGQYQTTE